MYKLTGYDERVTEEALNCERCGRAIPVLPLWTALSKRAKLTCRDCGHGVTHDYLMQRAEKQEFAKAVILAYGLLAQFGWVNYDTLVNAGVDGNPHKIGGLLTGLARAGLIKRAQPETRLGRYVDPRPVFVPGPRFPAVKVA